MPRRAELCPVETTARIVAGRWKAAVLEQLFEEAKRFSELKRAIPGITHRTLSHHLRELQKAGIVERTVYPDKPPRCLFGYAIRENFTPSPTGHVPLGKISFRCHGHEEAPRVGAPLGVTLDLGFVPVWCSFTLTLAGRQDS